MRYLNHKWVYTCLSAYACSLFSGCSTLCVSGTHGCLCWTKREQCTPSHTCISVSELCFDAPTRVNIQLHSFQETVRPGTLIRWIVTAQCPLLVGIGPEISESVKSIYDAAKVMFVTRSIFVIDDK
jgi:hypothetical protein